MKRVQRSVALSVFLLLTVSVMAQETKKITILYTNDVHSRLEPIAQKGDRNYGEGGFVRRATFLKEFRKENGEALLFDCGDFCQGTPYYNLFQGEAEVKMMNLMRYDAVTVGNHEFDFGLDVMERIFRMADFPIVSSNYDFSATGLKDLVKPYVILERDGLKIGVFGLGANPEGLIQEEKYRGMIYKEPIGVANETAELLKREGCDVVVCLSHLGIKEDERLVVKTRNIDVILGGHSHTFMNEPRNYLNADGKTIPVLHAGKSGVRVGKMDLTLKRR